MAAANPAPRPELRISEAAAQTRIVSGDPFGQAERRLSRDLNYMAGARIREFESCMPSQAVRSLGGMAGLEKCFRPVRGLV
jgi:hypothetical protein